MAADYAAVTTALAAVRERIAAAAGRAGRDSSSIRLVAISKTVPAEYVRAACDAGHLEFGVRASVLPRTARCAPAAARSRDRSVDAARAVDGDEPGLRGRRRGGRDPRARRHCDFRRQTAPMNCNDL